MRISHEAIYQALFIEGRGALKREPVTCLHTGRTLRTQYFPKGTDLSRWSSTDLEAVAMAINNRPRETLGWRTPAEVFEEQLRSLQQPGVATTE
ncbi:IS30 family transposase [Streptomyces aurantiacus]|nr:IS30 family transposase [Streptomyces aurantiacus]